jgi:alpha-1,3-rhamnosyltransferase
VVNNQTKIATGPGMSPSTAAQTRRYGAPVAPLVSVLVPIYNHERHVAEAAASIAAQSYPNIEVVAVDDGSSDASAEIAEAALAEHGVAYRLERQANQGIPRTFNRLLDLARGELLMIVASDDRLVPGAVARRVELLEQQPAALALFTDCRVIDDDGTVTSRSAMRDLWGADVEAFATNWHLGSSLVLMWSVVGPSLTLRRQALDVVGRFDEELRYEDVDFYLRLAATGRLRFDDVPTADYRAHDLNTWRVYGDEIGRAEYYRALSRNVPRLHGRDRLVALAKLRVDQHGHRSRLDPRRVAWNRAFNALRAAHLRRVATLKPLPELRSML